MANPFSIEPANPLQALMSGVAGYDRGAKSAKEGQIAAGRQEAMAALQSGGDPRTVLARLVSVGDLEGARTYSGFYENDATRAHREAELGFRRQEASRNQGNFETTHGENRRQFDTTQARQPPAMWRPTATGVAPVPGGTADPNYIASVQGAQAERAGATVHETIEAREQQAKRLNLDLNDPNVRGWVLTGKQPAEKPPLTAGDHKVITESENEIISADDVVKSLRRARDLVPGAYAGYGGGIRGRIGDSFPDWAVPDRFAAPDKSANTVELNQILGTESISAMSQALKGATTDKEMAEFKKLMADPNISVEVKTRAVDRLIAKAEAKKVALEGRVRQMREGTYFRPGGGVTGTPGGAQARPTTGTTSDSPPAQFPDARKAPDGNWYVERNGQTYRIDR
jgi:hypothetical protein